MNERTQKRLRDNAKQEGSCLVWAGRVDRHGYGKFSVENRETSVHRAAYLAANGEIPAGLCVCHSCDNRRCINPDHLFLGSSEENTADRNAKGRQAKGETSGASKLTECDVRKIRDLLASGVRQVDIASQFGVRQTLVSQIKLRQVWGHVA